MPSSPLDAIADLGFALGGGQALHAHGYGDRLSLDLDFYVTTFDQELFDRAETATLAALRARGYTAQVGHSDTWLRQILVNDPATGEQVLLDLGQDYRQNPPIVIAGLGPVIDLPDAASSKARALNDRRAARDYLDIHALLSHTPWTPTRLFTTLRDNLRPTITVGEFAADLAAAGQQDSRTPRTTTPTDSPTPISPASPPTSPDGQPNCEHKTSTILTHSSRIIVEVTRVTGRRALMLLSQLLSSSSVINETRWRDGENGWLMGMIWPMRRRQPRDKATPTM